MKDSLQKIIASFLALLVLLSTISWSVEKHLCMGRVMDVAFFHSASSCGMDETMQLMGETTSKMDCCTDESFTIEGQDNLKLTFNELELGQQQFLAAFSMSFLIGDTEDLELIVPHEEYPPPLPIPDYTKLYEVYLI